MSAGKDTGARTGTLWLIRHGPTHLKTFVGWTDVPADLSDADKISRLEAVLPEAPVISSDLSRAVKTADAVQNRRDRLPHDQGLREMYFGDWEGLTWSEIEQKDADLARKVFETPGHHAPPRGENWLDFSERVFTATEARAGDTIVVAHMGVILSLLQKALRCTAYEALGHVIDPLSLTVIERQGDWRDGGWSAREINQIF